MTRPVFPSSPQVTSIEVKHAKFPWHELRPGMSWQIRYDEVTLGTLKSMASRFGMKLGYKFRVHDHGLEAGYEVACFELNHNDIEFRKAKNKNKPKVLEKIKIMSEGEKVIAATQVSGKTMWEIEKDKEETK